MRLISRRAGTASNPYIIVIGVALLGAALGVPSAEGGTSAAKRYTIRVVNSPAGGGGATFHVGSPLNVTVVDRRSSTPSRIRLCVVPAPIDKASCRDAQTNRTVDTLAPSQPGLTKIRVRLPSGTTLVRPIRVHPGA